MTDLPQRPSSADVEDALTSAGFFRKSEPMAVLAAEILCLREAIGRCHSVQRVNSEAAKEWSEAAAKEPSGNAKVYARVYAEVASELERALR